MGHRREYYVEAVAESLSEHGVGATPEQIARIAARSRQIPRRKLPMLIIEHVSPFAETPRTLSMDDAERLITSAQRFWFPIHVRDAEQAVRSGAKDSVRLDLSADRREYLLFRKT